MLLGRVAAPKQIGAVVGFAQIDEVEGVGRFGAEWQFESFCGSEVAETAPNPRFSRPTRQ
jgi:hypothetical protein